MSPHFLYGAEVVKRFLCRERDAVTSGSRVEAGARERPSLRHRNVMWKLCGSKESQLLQQICTPELFPLSSSINNALVTEQVFSDFTACGSCVELFYSRRRLGDAFSTEVTRIEIAPSRFSVSTPYRSDLFPSKTQQVLPELLSVFSS